MLPKFLSLYIDEHSDLAVKSTLRFLRLFDLK